MPPDGSPKIPAQFRSDENRLHPDTITITEAWLMRRDIHTHPRMPIAIHSGYLFVTDKGQIVLARGGPVLEPPDKKFRSVFLRTVAHRRLAAIKWELFGDRVKKMFDALPVNFGAMIPVVQLLHEKQKGGPDMGLDTRLFESIRQGRGMAGLAVKPNTRLFQVADASSGTHPSAQQIYRAVWDYTQSVAAMMPTYNLLPARNQHGLNCHSYTWAAAEAAGVSKSVNDKLGLAVGKKRLKPIPVRLWHHGPLAPKTVNAFARVVRPAR